MNLAHPPLVVDIAFWVFAVAAIGCGWRVFETDSMVRASFLLLASFANVAAILLLLGGAYLGVALLFMMTVEMMVMAIFMVAFMMNPAGLNPMSMIHQPRLAAAAGWALFAGGVAVAIWGGFPHRTLTPGRSVTAELGTELMGRSMLIFETAGVVLVATMIGATVLSSRRSRFGDEAGDDGSLPPALDPAADPRSAGPAGLGSRAAGSHQHLHGAAS